MMFDFTGCPNKGETVQDGACACANTGETVQNGACACANNGETVQNGACTCPANQIVQNNTCAGSTPSF